MGRKRISNNHWTAGALIVILALLIFFAPSYGWTVREWLSPSPSGQNDPSATQADDATLAAQNDALRAQLASLQILSAQLPTSSPNEIRAMVYSRYPLNFKNELLVNAGSNDGVAAGAAVIFQGMLIGQVRTVFPNESLVQTIFDNNLKMPVRVGASGTNGLLQGGSNPTVGSIANNAPVASNDIVYSAAPGIPYALPVAIIVATSTSADSLFQQATLSLPYDINAVETVFIAK